MAKKSVAEIMTAVRNWCADNPVKLCVLFGSQATGKARPDSDIDLAVWPSRPIEPLVKLNWLVALEKLLDADVSLAVVSPLLDPVLGFELVRDGRLIFEAEPELWLKEQSRLWHIYNDTRPLRRAEREQLHQFAEEIRRGA